VTRLNSQFLGYFLTAGTAAVVDIGGFVLLTAQGLAILTSAIISFLVAMVVNYTLSSRYVFRTDSTASRFFLFAGGAMLGLAINVSITWAAATQLGLAPTLAKIAGVGTAFLFNFAINKALVFRTSGKSG
jgi:putative flippase GtrA